MRSLKKALDEKLDFANQDWEVVEDPEVVAVYNQMTEENRRIAEEAARMAEESAARQRAAQQALMVKMEMESARIAREEKTARIGVMATHSAAIRKDAAKQIQQLHETLSDELLKLVCWRCGQRGRLPVEDAALFRSTGAASSEDPRRLYEARKEAVEAWARYNFARLGVEVFRMHRNYHPALAHRFSQERDCEVCGSRGVFHAEAVSGVRREYLIYDSSKLDAGDMKGGLEKMVSQAVIRVAGTFSGYDWVPVLQLSREQAKTWLRTAEREIVTRDWAQSHDEIAAFERKVREGKIVRNIVDRKDVTWWGRYAPDYQETKIKDFAGRKMETSYMDRPAKRGLGYVIWPNRYFGRGSQQRYWDDPAAWIGGPAARLVVKAGVEYDYDSQDPISKAPRIRAVPAPAAGPPTIAKFAQRRAHYTQFNRVGTS